MTTVKAECSSCGGTGLYSGMCEARGEAVVCLTCQGTGCEEIRYRPFLARKSKNGVNIVRRSRGAFLPTGVGPIGGSITYAEFKAGRMP